MPNLFERGDRGLPPRYPRRRMVDARGYVHYLPNRRILSGFFMRAQKATAGAGSSRYRLTASTGGFAVLALSRLRLLSVLSADALPVKASTPIKNNGLRKRA